MGHAVQKIKKLSETPRTLHKIAKLCVIDCKNTDCKNTDCKNTDCKNTDLLT